MARDVHCTTRLQAPDSSHQHGNQHARSMLMDTLTPHSLFMHTEHADSLCTPPHTLLLHTAHTHSPLHMDTHSSRTVHIEHHLKTQFLMQASHAHSLINALYAHSILIYTSHEHILLLHILHARLYLMHHPHGHLLFMHTSHEHTPRTHSICTITPHANCMRTHTLSAKSMFKLSYTLHIHTHSS